MNSTLIEIDASAITSEETFHDVFSDAFGFPDYYGRNMDAWIDCMTYLDDADAGMTNVHVEEGGVLVLTLLHSTDFRERLPKLFAELIEVTLFVNYRRVEVGRKPVLALLPT